jgi:hypothetical protein
MRSPSLPSHPIPSHPIPPHPTSLIWQLLDEKSLAAIHSALDSQKSVGCGAATLSVNGRRGAVRLSADELARFLVDPDDLIVGCPEEAARGLTQYTLTLTLTLTLALTLTLTRRRPRAGSRSTP